MAARLAPAVNDRDEIWKMVLVGRVVDDAPPAASTVHRGTLTPELIANIMRIALAKVSLHSVCLESVLYPRTLTLGRIGEDEPGCGPCTIRRTDSCLDAPIACDGKLT